MSVSLSLTILVGNETQAGKYNPQKTECTIQLIKNELTTFKKFVTYFNVKSKKKFKLDTWYKFTDFDSTLMLQLANASTEAGLTAVVEHEWYPVCERVQYLTSLSVSGVDGEAYLRFDHFHSRQIYKGNRSEINHSYSDGHLAIGHRHPWNSDPYYWDARFMIPSNPEFQKILRGEEYDPNSYEDTDKLFTMVAPLRGRKVKK